MSVERFMLGREDAVVLIVDVQERLAGVMEARERVSANCVRLIEAAKVLGIPALVTEQYPKGLGHTLPEILAALPEGAPVEKMTFDCCGEPAFMQRLAGTGRKKIMLAGMEAHICVLQTALSLLGNGYTVHAVSDAMCSRTEHNWRVGLEMMRDAGAVVTCTETALFQLLGIAGTDEFRAVSKMVK